MEIFYDINIDQLCYKTYVLGILSIRDIIERRYTIAYNSWKTDN